MNNFFTIRLITNEKQKLAYVGLCTKGEALEWGKANRHRHHTWVGINEVIKTYYGNHYQADRAYNEIVTIKQTSMVQWYLNDIDQLNVCAGMPNHHLINIIVNGIPSRLRFAMAHYENLYATPIERKKKLLVLWLR